MIKSISGMITLYTDGSCTPNPGKGGWAFIAVFDDFDIEDSGKSENTTNNIMEMTAVIEGLSTFPEEKEFTVYSDSQYVINCAQGKWQRKKNIDLWQKYDKISRNKKITFVWVKGHSGDHYNERVDKLAKK
jgi:ribonuclease HI